MIRPYIRTLRIENFGCIQSASLALGPLHALIGPNDTGKSTVLQALAFLGLMGEANPQVLHDALHDRGTRGPSVVQRVEDEGRVRDVKFEVDLTNGLTWRVQRNRNGCFEKIFPTGNEANVQSTELRLNQGSTLAKLDGGLALVVKAPQFLRLDPDALRRPSSLITEGQSIRLRDERGTGLAAVFDALQSRDDEFISRVGKRLRDLFPSVQQLALRNTGSAEKAIGIKLRSGELVPASSVSEGVLYFLAFAALEHMEAGLVLIEEPENGLHPARIKEVMGILRAVSERTQIILATHSPLVVNALEPHEVSVLTRSPEHGTEVRLISETPDFKERQKVYALGELWVSYANGTDEAPLLAGEPS